MGNSLHKERCIGPWKASLCTWQGFFVLFVCEYNISYTAIFAGISLYCEIDHFRVPDGLDRGADHGGIGIHTQKLNSKKKNKEFLHPVGCLEDSHDYFKVLRRIIDMFAAQLLCTHV